MRWPTSRAGDLVDRDARVDIGAGGLLDPDSGEERRAGAGVVARPVLAAGGVLLVQPGDDLQLVLEPLQRLHRPVELEPLAFLLFGHQCDRLTPLGT